MVSMDSGDRAEQRSRAGCQRIVLAAFTTQTPSVRLSACWLIHLNAMIAHDRTYEYEIILRTVPAQQGLIYSGGAKMKPNFVRDLLYSRHAPDGFSDEIFIVLDLDTLPLKPYGQLVRDASNQDWELMLMREPTVSGNGEVNGGVIAFRDTRRVRRLIDGWRRVVNCPAYPNTLGNQVALNALTGKHVGILDVPRRRDPTGEDQRLILKAGVESCIRAAGYNKSAFRAELGSRVIHWPRGRVTGVLHEVTNQTVVYHGIMTRDKLKLMKEALGRSGHRTMYGSPWCSAKAWSPRDIGDTAWRTPEVNTSTEAAADTPCMLVKPVPPDSE